MLLSESISREVEFLLVISPISIASFAFPKKSIVCLKTYAILALFFLHILAQINLPWRKKSARIRGFARAFKCACGRRGCVAAINSSVLINGTGRADDVAKADEEQSSCLPQTRI